jgi:hypothetical protein
MAQLAEHPTMKHFCEERAGEDLQPSFVLQRDLAPVSGQGSEPVRAPLRRKNSDSRFTRVATGFGLCFPSLQRTDVQRAEEFSARF